MSPPRPPTSRSGWRLLASYPLIDVVASIAGARYEGASGNVLRVNAAVSTAAVVAIAVTGFGSDAGATLASFGAWAAISGAIQLGGAIHARRSRGGQLPMIVSGGLSTGAWGSSRSRAGTMPT